MCACRIFVCVVWRARMRACLGCVCVCACVCNHTGALECVRVGVSLCVAVFVVVVKTDGPGRETDLRGGGISHPSPTVA